MSGQIQHTIGPSRRLALIGDSGARWTVYDVDSGWARVSRRWTRRIEGDWSQGFVGSTGAFVGYYGGTLARIHRVSDGEVLNLRAVTRTVFDEEYPSRPLPTHLLAFSDSGWFDMNGGQPIHLRVRDGAAFDAEMASPRGNPHRREGLVAAFFSGQRLAAQPE